MAGFGNSAQALFSTVRELVENSLDACENVGVHPNVKVTIQRLAPSTYEVSVSDNGSGIPPQLVPDAFGRILYGSKYEIKQHRGTFGLGVTMAILYGQITTDAPVKVYTKQKNGTGHYFELYIDIKANRPIIEKHEQINKLESGTTVAIQLKGDLKRAKDRIIEYFRLSSIATPHARFIVEINDNSPLILGPWSKQLPPRPLLCKPHPHSADIELLKRLIEKAPNDTLHEFLVQSFQQVGHRTAKRFLQFANFSSRQKVGSLTRDQLVELSFTLRNYEGFSRPINKCLSPIGKDSFISAVKSVFSPEFVTYSVRDTCSWDGHPFILEGAIALLSQVKKNDTPLLFRFANRVPLLYDAGEDGLTRTLKQTNWSRYGLSSKKTIALFIHLCSTRIPYKAAGKQSIASIKEIEKESLSLYRELGRKLSRMLVQQQHSVRERKKLREFEKMFQLVARFSSELTNSPIPSTNEMVRRLFEVF